MSNNIECPLCESKDVITSVRINNYFEPFGGSAEVELNENHCNSCGISADFTDSNDATIESILEKLKANSAMSILNDFAEGGYKFASMERVLELPQRTLARWKSTGNASAAGLALLRFIRLFPWLLEVADKRFEFNEAQRISVNSALKNVTFQDPLAKDYRPTTSDIYNLQINNNQTFNIEINPDSGELLPAK